jgi:hypothetical protein
MQPGVCAVCHRHEITHSLPGETWTSLCLWNCLVPSGHDFCVHSPLMWVAWSTCRFEWSALHVTLHHHFRFETLVLQFNPFQANMSFISNHCQATVSFESHHLWTNMLFEPHGLLVIMPSSYYIIEYSKLCNVDLSINTIYAYICIEMKESTCTFAT